MKHALLTVATGTALALGSTTLTTAQTVLSGDHSVDGKLCVGTPCDGAETFDQIDAQKIKGSLVSLRFEDTSGATHPNRDWRLRVNDGGSFADGGLDRFSIEDVDAGTIPFTIVGDAPTNSFFVSNFGNVGLGTTLPVGPLHIVNQGYSQVKLESTGTQSRTWDLYSNGNTFTVRDSTDFKDIFVVGKSAPSHSLTVSQITGNVGVGTQYASAPFEVSRDETYNYFRITAAQALINQSVDITFTGGPLGTGELRYNIVDDDGPEMKLNAEGDMEIDGALTTGGPTCASGCDAVFDAEFERLSVTEHAALMWENGHLPAVGPTLPGQPMNVSEKMGAVLNELEHAHIYIEELHAEQAAANARIARLEAALQALTEH
ncbi:hypothetical protein [Roseovarius indicus]|uniref:hypothetical protein n=1 Tax=Roseovarius indicus TaxID=540747 RepID=UPI0007D9ED16|nr:hypothetical protein [Roseovarius indicus]OAO06412.1 hypothetical protein A8B76_08745 [Roseovarius indicus]